MALGILHAQSNKKINRGVDGDDVFFRTVMLQVNCGCLFPLNVVDDRNPILLGDFDFTITANSNDVHLLEVVRNQTGNYCRRIICRNILLGGFAVRMECFKRKMETSLDHNQATGCPQNGTVRRFAQSEFFKDLILYYKFQYFFHICAPE